MSVGSTNSPQGSNSSSSSSTAGETPATDRSIPGYLASPSRQSVQNPGLQEGAWPCASLVGNAEVSPGPTRLLPPLTRLPAPHFPSHGDSSVFSGETEGIVTSSPSHTNCSPHLTAPCPPQTDETETSFTAKPPLTRTNVGYDVFEPRTNSGDKFDRQNQEGPRNSVGSSEFSPIRRSKVKGNVETV